MDDHQQPVDISRYLHGVPEAQYGPEYRSHYLSQYRDYVASADAISGRRKTANDYFLGINTAFIGAVSYFEFDDPMFLWVAPLVGILMCWAWMGLIGSYRQLNGAKFKVIQAMEGALPLTPYLAEQKVYSSGPRPRKAFSQWESRVPLFYMALHAFVGIANWLMEWSGA